MITAIKEAWYLLGIWIILRVNRRGAGELLERWGGAIKELEAFKK